MACKEFSNKVGIDPSDEKFITTLNYHGSSCIMTHRSKCEICTNTVENQKHCFSCLSNNGQKPTGVNKNIGSCVVSDGGNSYSTCCQYVLEASTCESCISKSGSINACLRSGKLSKGALIGIILGSIVLIAITVVIIVWINRFSDREQNRARRLADISARKSGINMTVLTAMSDKQLEEIDDNLKNN